jgi:hypothetical protein
MRTLTAALVALLVGACAGDSPGPASRTCNGATYDLCADEHNCKAPSIECRTFLPEGFQVCTTACTAGGAPCPDTFDGKPATCGSNGFCKPPAANDCAL